MLDQMSGKPFAVDLTRRSPLDVRHQGIDQRTPERLDIDKSVEHDCTKELLRPTGTVDCPITQVRRQQPGRRQLAADRGLNALEVSHLFAAPFQ